MQRSQSCNISKTSEENNHEQQPLQLLLAITYIGESLVPANHLNHQLFKSVICCIMHYAPFFVYFSKLVEAFSSSAALILKLIHVRCAYLASESLAKRPARHLSLFETGINPFILKD